MIETAKAILALRKQIDLKIEHDVDPDEIDCEDVVILDDLCVIHGPRLAQSYVEHESELTTLRARISRLSALLDEAEAALGVFARGSEQGIQYVSHIWTGARPAPTVQSDLKRAASVAAKIAKEKSDEDA